MPQQRKAVRALVGRVGIGEVLADVAERQCTEKRVHHRVRQHIRVRMAVQTKLKRNIYAADDAVSALDQSVYVIAMSDSHIHSAASLCINASATRMSSGVVTLMFS